MKAPEKTSVIFHADQEHSGIRLVIFITLFVGLFAGFRLLTVVLDALATPSWADYVTFLSCLGSLPLALLMVWGLEKLLKRVWHSGLSLVLDGRGVRVDDRRKGAMPRPVDEQDLLWSAPISQVRWYFQLKGYPRGGRERRVSDKWLCLAAELQQEDNRLSVFTFVPPQKAVAWTEDARAGFRRINPAELYEKSVRSRIGPPTRPTLPPHLLQTKDARYWLAERRRWEQGIELSPDDFCALLDKTANGGNVGLPDPPITTN